MLLRSITRHFAIPALAAGMLVAPGCSRSVSLVVHEDRPVHRVRTVHVVEEPVYVKAPPYEDDVIVVRKRKVIHRHPRPVHRTERVHVEGHVIIDD